MKSWELFYFLCENVLMHCLKISAITFACIRNCDIYICIYVYIHIDTHTHTHIYTYIYIWYMNAYMYTHTHTLIHKLWSWARVNYASFMCITFLLKLTIFLIMYTFLRYISRGFQHSKFGRTFKEIKFV